VVFGYITATLASFFVEADARSKNTAVPNAADHDNLQLELAQIRSDLQAISEKLLTNS
jgi:voltage-gated potassium channel